MVGLCPWTWVNEPPDLANSDIVNYYYNCNHGRMLQNEVYQKRAELMEAFFPLRTSHHVQCMSWPELEYSYGIHLKNIIDRTGFAYCNNITGFVDSDITLVLIEIGRFFNEIDSSNRPIDFHRGIFPGAVGPFANGPWPQHIIKHYTLHELHRRCSSKNLLKDWEDRKINRFIFKNARSELMSCRQAELVYILEAILIIQKGDSNTGHLVKPISISEGECNRFILDFLDDYYQQNSEESLCQADCPVFSEKEFNFKTLQSLGGLSILWTDLIDDHLRLSPSSRTLKLFWDISLLDQSLLFWSQAQCLKKFR